MENQLKAKKVKYQKPKMYSKKVKISFFLSQVAILDQFSIMGNVYAQSGGCSSASTSTNNSGSSSDLCSTGMCG